jgi:ABC-type dipeptide/oligopeptide/nickel transport system permease subunit
MERPSSTSPETKPSVTSTSAIRVFANILRRNRGALAGFIVVAILFGTAIAIAIADLLRITITPYNPLQQGVGVPLAAPSWSHLFGTDQLGRDVFSRVVVATPYDMGISLAVVMVGFTVGVLVGSFAGFRGGAIDEVFMRITDIFFALPVLILAIVITEILGQGALQVMVVLMFVWWPTYARLARGETLRLTHESFIDAARMSGRGRMKILLTHMVPNLLFVMLAYATLDIGNVVLAYSGLSYLGLGVTPPQPDWGQMVSAYQDFMLSSPWLPLFPGAVIAAGVIGFSVLGDGIRDALEIPKR